MAIKISVVIPTRNRPGHVRTVLQTLQNQTYKPAEIIIADSSDIISINKYEGLPVSWVHSVPSVCVQRNLGINRAVNDWILLCDDDLELPSDYLEKLVSHIEQHPEAGAVSGIVLQKKNSDWVGQYPLTSTMDLIFRYIFHLSIWGDVRVSKKNFVASSIINYYKKKGNHISKSGWPIITDFSGEYFKSPIYGLGASLVKREWLNDSPYDEILDPHGIGDNYGVALGFPPEGIHVLNQAFVYHHEATENRLESPLQFYRRILALDYFLTNSNLKPKHVKKRWFLWSLLGNMIRFLLTGNMSRARVTWKLIVEITANRNPYVLAKKSGVKICRPEL